MHSARCFTGKSNLPFTLVAPLPGEQTRSNASLIAFGGLSRRDALWVNVEPDGAFGPFCVVVLQNDGQPDVRLTVGGIPSARIITARDVKRVVIDNAGGGHVNLWLEQNGAMLNDDGGPGDACDPTGIG